MRQPTEGEQRIIRVVLDMGSASRKEISERVDISPVVLASTLDRLLTGGALTRANKVGSRGGRPAFHYSPSSQMGYSVGVAVQSDAIRTLAIDPMGNVLVRQEMAIPLDVEPGVRISDATVQAIRQIIQLLHSDQLSRENLLSIGISIEGTVDTRRGVWRAASPYAADQQVNLKWAVEERFKCPVTVEAAPRAIAFYEKRLASGKGAPDLAVLFLGTTVGAGVFVDDRLLLGHEGMIGDVAHLPVTAHGQRCTCGSVGCLQTIASVSGLLRAVSERLEEGVASVLQGAGVQGAGSLTLETIREAADKKDSLVRAIIFDTGLGVGAACATMFRVYDPGKLVISGPLSCLHSYLRSPVEHACEGKVGHMRGLDSMIEFALYSPDQEAIGAALISLHAKFGLVY